MNVITMHNIVFPIIIGGNLLSEIIDSILDLKFADTLLKTSDVIPKIIGKTILGMTGIISIYYFIS